MQQSEHCSLKAQKNPAVTKVGGKAVAAAMRKQWYPWNLKYQQIPVLPSTSAGSKSNLCQNKSSKGNQQQQFSVWYLRLGLSLHYSYPSDSNKSLEENIKIFVSILLLQSLSGFGYFTGFFQASSKGHVTGQCKLCSLDCSRIFLQLWQEQFSFNERSVRNFFECSWAIHLLFVPTSIL